MDLSNGIQILASIPQVTVLIWGLALGHGLYAVVTSTAVQWLGVALLSWLALRRVAPAAGWPTIRIRGLQPGWLRFSAVLQVSTILGLTQLQVDKLLIALWIGLVSVSEFELGFRVANGIQSLPLLALGPLLPVFAELHAGGRTEESRNLLRKGTVNLNGWAFGIAACSIPVAPFLVRAWVGPNHREAEILAAWLLAAYLLNLCTGVASAAVRGAGRPGLEIAPLAAGLALHLVASRLLLGHMGPVGAGPATLVAVALSTRHRIPPRLWACYSRGQSVAARLAREPDGHGRRGLSHGRCRGRALHAFLEDAGSLVLDALLENRRFLMSASPPNRQPSAFSITGTALLLGAVSLAFYWVTSGTVFPATGDGYSELQLALHPPQSRPNHLLLTPFFLSVHGLLSTVGIAISLTRAMVITNLVSGALGVAVWALMARVVGLRRVTVLLGGLVMIVSWVWWLHSREVESAMTSQLFFMLSAGFALIACAREESGTILGVLASGISFGIATLLSLNLVVFVPFLVMLLPRSTGLGNWLRCVIWWSLAAALTALPWFLSAYSQSGLTVFRCSVHCGPWLAWPAASCRWRPALRWHSRCG
jgi:hypothetical protein